jgi:WD40 repeat protein
MNINLKERLKTSVYTIRKFFRFLDIVFGYDVFISYAWEDGRGYAERLYRQLAGRGFSVFLDDHEMYAGNELRSELRRSLKASSVLLVVVSEGMLSSGHVADEVRSFDLTGRNIVPIVPPSIEPLFHEPLEMPPELPIDATQASRNTIRAYLLAVLRKRIWLSDAIATERPTDRVLTKISTTVGVFRQKRIRTVATITSLIVFLVVAITATGFAIAFKFEEERSNRNLISALLAIAEENLAGGNADMALKAAIGAASLETNRPHSAELYDVMARAIRAPLRATVELAQNVTAADLSPDGTQIVTGYGRSIDSDVIRIIDVSTGKQLDELGGFRGAVHSVAWSPNGDYVAASSEDGRGRIFGPLSRSALVQTNYTPLGGYNEFSSRLLWAPDSNHIMLLKRNGAQTIWNVHSGELTGSYGAPKDRDQNGSIFSWSPDGNQAVTTFVDGTTRVITSNKETQPTQLEGETRNATGFSWSPDKSLVSALIGGRKIRIWSALNGKHIDELVDSTEDYVISTWSPTDRLLATIRTDGTVSIWNAETRSEVWSLPGYAPGASIIAWSPDGRRLALSWSEGLRRVGEMQVAFGRSRVLAVRDGHEVGRFADTGSRIDMVRLLPGTRDFVRDPGQFWKKLPFEELFGLDTEQEEIRTIAWSPDGKQLVAGTSSGAVSVFDSITGVPLRRLAPVNGSVISIAWSPNKHKIAVGASNVHLREAISGQAGKIINTDNWKVLSLAWSPDGTRLAGGANRGEVKIWNSTTGNIVSKLSQSHDVNTVAWSPDGHKLAVTSFNNVKILTLGNSESILSFSGHIGNVEDLAWSPNSRWIATAASSVGNNADNTARVWEAATGTEVALLDGHTSEVESVDWSPDGTRIATSTSDGTIRVWDTASFEEIASVEGYARTTIVSFSPDGHRLAAVTGNTARVFDVSTLPKGDLIVYACNRLSALKNKIYTESGVEFSTKICTND